MVAFALSAAPARRWRRSPTCCARRSLTPAATRETTLHEVRALLSQLHQHHEQLQHTRQITPQLRQFVSDFRAFLCHHGSEAPHLEQECTTDGLLQLMQEEGVLAAKALEVIREPAATPSVMERDSSALQAAASALIRQQQQQPKETRSGLMSRRNAYWMAIPMRYARSHEYIAALPAVASQSFDKPNSLRRLQHDSEAFHVASCLSYMRAADLWTFLGLAERSGEHHLSLDAWKRSVCNEVTKRTFVQRFQMARRANALLLYAEACRDEWAATRSNTLCGAHAVRLFEEGLYMGEGDLHGIVAAPTASVWQRSEKDYWMWERSVHKLLLVHALPVFRTSVRPYCRCDPHGAPARLPVRAFVEAQLTMACSNKTSADILLYGTLQQSRVFGVKRDDRFVSEALAMSRWFEREFLRGIRPPEEAFHRRYERFASVWRLADEGVRAATEVWRADALTAETWLAPLRARLNAWEVRHSAQPFR